MLRSVSGRALLCMWEFRDSPVCDCENGEQTVNYIITRERQRRKFSRGFVRLHVETPETVNWIINLGIHLQVVYNPPSHRRTNGTYYTSYICKFFLS